MNNIKNDPREVSDTTSETNSLLDSMHMDRLLYLEGIRNWSFSERSNIERALDIQLSKLDTEWSSHEIKLQKEHHEDISRFELRYNIRIPLDEEETKKTKVMLHDRNDDIQWKDSIQQSNLIHTAPSLTPSMFHVGSKHNDDLANREMSGDYADGKDMHQIYGGVKKANKLNSLVKTGALQPSALKEFREIEKNYEINVQTLKFQKEMAKKWIYRQHSRINSHLNFVEKEKRVE